MMYSIKTEFENNTRTEYATPDEVGELLEVFARSPFRRGVVVYRDGREVFRAFKGVAERMNGDVVAVIYYKAGTTYAPHIIPDPRRAGDNWGATPYPSPTC